jgi:hypothetical protein
VKLQRLTPQQAKGALPRGYDYYLATTRYFGDKNFPKAPIVHRIGREGATFAVIKGHHSTDGN